MRSLYCLLVVCLLGLCSGEQECPELFRYPLKLDKQGNTAEMDLNLKQQDGNKCIYEDMIGSVITGQISDEPGKGIIYEGKFREANFGYTLTPYTGQWICPKQCVHSMIEDVDYVVCRAIRYISY